VRDYAATLNDKEQGMAQKSAKFKEMGSSVYLDADKVKESNLVLSPDALTSLSSHPR
jgi:phosphomethylpyrimidine synthase